MDYERWSYLLDENHHVTDNDEETYENEVTKDDVNPRMYLIKYIRILILIACVTIIYLVGVHLILQSSYETTQFEQSMLLNTSDYKTVIGEIG